MKANLYLKENTQGTDWVVADIHGEYNKLLKKLDEVCFDFEVDRLLCSGDLVDRGPYSYRVVKLLDQPWFFSTLGNHESMCIEAYKHSHMEWVYRENGGDWFFDLSKENQDEVIEKLMGLPLTICTKVNGKSILLVHARVPEDNGDSPWLDEERKMYEIPKEYIEDATWNRHFSSSRHYMTSKEVKAFDLVCVGHTVLKAPTRMANSPNLYIGVVYDSTKDFVLYNPRTEEIV